MAPSNRGHFSFLGGAARRARAQLKSARRRARLGAAGSGPAARRLRHLLSMSVRNVSPMPYSSVFSCIRRSICSRSLGAASAAAN